MDKDIEQNGSPSGESTNKIVLWLNRAEDTLLVTCLVVMVVLAFVNIVIRNTIGGGIVWADKLLINLVMWVAMLGGAIASKDKNHITIDIVSTFTPKKYHKYFNVFTNSFAAVVCGLLTYSAYLLVATIEYPDHKEFIPHVESWVPMAVIPFGFALMTFRFARLMILDVYHIIKGGNDS